MSSPNPEIDRELLSQMRIINTNIDPDLATSLAQTAEERRNEEALEAELLKGLTPFEREQHINTKFFTELIDKRFSYAEKLAPIARHNFRATGIETEFQVVPQELLDHLPSDYLKGFLSLGFETDKDDSFALTDFAIELEDGPQIEIKTDWLSTSLLVNGESVGMYLDSDLTFIKNMLRYLLPAGAPDLKPAALAYALYTQGTYRSHTMKVGNEDAQFVFTSEETADDSSHVLEINASLPEHASGKTIVLKASMVEGLLQATHKVSPQGALDLSAVPTLESEDAKLYVEQIIGQRTVNVKRLTGVHREIIGTTLQEFEKLAKRHRRPGQRKN